MGFSTTFTASTSPISSKSSGAGGSFAPTTTVSVVEVSGGFETSTTQVPGESGPSVNAPSASLVACAFAP